MMVGQTGGETNGQAARAGGPKPTLTLEINKRTRISNQSQILKIQNQREIEN
jgi:hypothetical protein